MSSDYTVMLFMVFLAVFFLARSLMVPTFGTEATTARRMRGRIRNVIGTLDEESSSLIRERYLKQMTPFERWLDELPGMSRLSMLMLQAGSNKSNYSIVLQGLAIAVICGGIIGLVTREPLFVLPAMVLGFMAPFFKLKRDRDKRLLRFEEQLPEALDVMSRALRAGYPFVDALKLVSEERDDPIAGEFGATFADINYGMSYKAAFYSLLERLPSISLMAVVTAVLIQKETGGNMSEILDKIAAVIRSRFRFHRKVRTLSAEARMSAWILTAVPFILAAVISLVAPDYLPMLTKDPLGRKLIIMAFIMMMIGIMWMRRIIRIEV